MDKKELGMLNKHVFLMGKNTVEVKQWPDKCYGEHQLLLTGMLNLNAYVQTPMMLKALVAKFGSCSRKHHWVHKMVLAARK